MSGLGVVGSHNNMIVVIVGVIEELELLINAVVVHHET